MDIAKRLEELKCMDLFDFDGQMHLSLRSSSIIVAAEIIAEAIKEAASPKEETATIHNFTLNLPKGNREIYEEIQQLLAQRAQNPLLKLQESDHPGAPDSQHPQQYTGTREESEDESPQL